MKPFIIACAVFAALALPRLAAAQTPHHEDSPSTGLHLSDSLVVGAVTLQPGDYRFQCKTFNGESFLVVTREDDGKEIARVPCTPENLPEKVKVSEFRSRTSPDGKKTLSSVRIKGETIAHTVLN